MLILRICDFTMKKTLYTLLLSTIIFGLRAQNLTVNNSAPYNSPYWLAANVLVDPQFVIYQPFDPNTGIPIPQPATNQVGRFNAVGTGFPIDSGIVMCANSIQDVLPGQVGPNPNTGPFIDAELSSVLTAIGSGGYNINDRVQITFSFIATSDSIQFNYVFGSHEYPTYTCSSFNDVFGFFLTGQGINGNPSNSTVNLATIPNTGVPVAINTINQGFPGSAGNATNCIAANPNYAAHSVYYNASSGSVTSLGGYTTKFTARAQVTCGNTYTIRLALANVSDHALSSAVFLEAKSFKSPSINISSNLNFGNTFADTSMIEGCFPSYIKFKKDGNVNEGMGINFAFSGSAQNGIDLLQVPDSLWIPPGIAADSILLQPVDDGVTESFEDFIITMQPVTTACYVYPPEQIKVFIRDKVPVQVGTSSFMISDTIQCPGDTASIVAQLSGGEGIVSGFWLDDPTLPTRRTVQPTQTTTYYFGGVDECDQDTVIDSVTIYIADYQPVQYTTQVVQVCRGETASFTLDISNGSPPFYIYWHADNSTLTTFSAIPTADSTYYLFTVTDRCGNQVTDSMLAIIAPDPLANFTYLNSYNVPLRVDFTSQSANAASYLWDFGNGSTSNDTNPVVDYDRPGTYNVTLQIISPDGCVDEFMLTVIVESDFYLYVPAAFTPDGDGLNECFLVKGVGFESYEIKIFDRWGNMVYYGDDIDACWDGIVNGTPARQGVYTYTIFLRLPFDKIHQENGVLSVIR